MHYYEHKTFENGVRVSKELEVAPKENNDTLRKILHTYNSKGLKLESDQINYDYPGRVKVICTYNEREQETGYYYLHYKNNGTFDTAYIHKTTYDIKGRPVTKVFPKANGKDIFKYTDFDSVSAELAIRDGKELPNTIFFYDQNKRLSKINDYMWVIDTLPIQRSIYYFYDTLGRISKSLYFSSCDIHTYYSGPGTFCLNSVDYFKYDSKGRELEHYKRIRPDDKYKK